MQHVTALKCLNPWLADQSTELLLFIFNGVWRKVFRKVFKYMYLNTLQKYLNTVIKYKLKNVFKYCPALLIPDCNPNYRNWKRCRATEQKTPVFRLPCDAAEYSRWMKAMPYTNITTRQESVICEKHWPDSRVVSYSLSVDGTYLLYNYVHLITNIRILNWENWWTWNFSMKTNFW